MTKENVPSSLGQPGRPAPSLQEIQQPLSEGIQPRNWDREPLSAVIGYIVQKHHAYCRHAIATIEPLLSEVARQHREKHPEVRRITLLFAKFSSELLRHLVKEEDTLFPYIARMEEAASRKEVLPRPTYGSVANPVRMMMMEHEASNEDFKMIRQACNNYACPADVAPNISVLYATLQEFEQDLQIHSELEDKVLFPRAIALEQAAQPSANRKSASPR